MHRANILLVESDGLVAATLRSMVELDPRHCVIAIADGLHQALGAVDRHRVDVALVDIQLTHFSTGYAVADALVRLGIRCIFVIGNAPPWAMPELAIGCIEKPFSAEDVANALNFALQSRRAEITSSGSFERY
jgi:CheY-like chemotaxis protein